MNNGVIKIREVVFVGVVDMPVVQVLLAAVMVLSILVEIKTGGMGAGILLGIVAAAVFWGSQYVKGLVELYHIAIFLVGILCIVAELLLPTVGLLAGLGVAAMIYSMVLAMGGDMNAVYALLIAFVLAIAVFLLIVKKLPSSRLWEKVVLHDKATEQRGYVSTEPKQHLLGKTGVVLTELRPSGTVLVEGEQADVVSEGAFVAKGEFVEVISVHGSRVVVRRTEKEK